MIGLGRAEILGSCLPHADEMDAYERVLSDDMAGYAALLPGKTMWKRLGGSSIQF